jgi:hypothetical protein
MKRGIVLLILLGVPCPALPCPVLACGLCCTSRQPTLRQEAAQASAVVYGTLANPRQGRDGQGNATPKDIDGTTDLFIEQSIKTHPALAGMKRLELQRYVTIDPKQPRFLILFDIQNGKVDPYQGFPATPAVVDYLQGMLAINPKDTHRILAHAFRHLEHPDPTIAGDAFREFEFAEYGDYRAFARTLLPDQLARWLADPQTTTHRRGLYAFLLGHCGSARDARLLRDFLDNPSKRQISGLDRVLLGYLMLQPKEGWEFIQGLLSDARGDFLERYAALRAVRFLWETRPDLVPRHQLFDAVCTLLDQSDIADLVVEDLRKWGRWDALGRVLALEKQQEFWDIPIMRRAVIRFALSCPQPAAAAFVQRMRKQLPELVQDQEESLKLEAKLEAEEQTRRN